MQTRKPQATAGPEEQTGLDPPPRRTSLGSNSQGPLAPLTEAGGDGRRSSRDPWANCAEHRPAASAHHGLGDSLRAQAAEPHTLQHGPMATATLGKLSSGSEPQGFNGPGSQEAALAGGCTPSPQPRHCPGPPQYCSLSPTRDATVRSQVPHPPEAKTPSVHGHPRGFCLGPRRRVRFYEPSARPCSGSEMLSCLGAGHDQNPGDSELSRGSPGPPCTPGNRGSPLGCRKTQQEGQAWPLLLGAAQHPPPNPSPRTAAPWSTTPTPSLSRSPTMVWAVGARDKVCTL